MDENNVINFVIKRDKSQVTFDPSRITSAILSAARAVGGHDDLRASFLTDRVVEALKKGDNFSTPDVEKIQDKVEEILIEYGHTKTARAYMRYRITHDEARSAKRKELLEKVGRHEATITNQKGETEAFDVSKVVEVLSFYCSDLLKIDLHNLVLEAVGNLYNGITIKELDRNLINAARAKIEVNPQYSLLAARLLLRLLYQEVLGLSITKNQLELKKRYRSDFANYIKKGVELNLLDKKLLDFDLAKLSTAMIPARDDIFHFRGIQTLYDRYLLRNNNKELIEMPQYFWMRVAMGVALAEDKLEQTERAIEFYHLISEMFYVPSTPTLFNAGTVHPQLSSCFLNSVDDSLVGIFKNFSDDALLSKYAGGIGTDWTNVRAMGSSIKGTNGFSQGVIPFLKIFNDVALAVNQGGKRKGAMCAYLEMWHSDIYEFIEARKNTGDERRRLHDCHTAVWIPDLFIKRVIEKKNWTLFSPVEVPDLHHIYGLEFEKRYAEYEDSNLSSAHSVPAESLWRKLLTMVYETGHPWLTFKDPCNIRNPQSHVGVIHNSNLCTEITLNNSNEETAVCNLGSINLERFVNSRILDRKALKSAVVTAIRMLDNVIDINFYPTVEAKKSNMLHRPIGLGVMGYQDALYKMDYNFESEENLNFSDELLENISYFAISASADLARERGAYSSFKGSYWDRGIFPYDSLQILEKARSTSLEIDMQKNLDWDSLKAKVKNQGMRNSNCLAIAPTATISNIAGVYPCIEPAFKNVYVKENTDGSFIVVNNYLLQELENLGLWSDDILNKIKLDNGSVQKIDAIPPRLKEKYKETFEIDQKWIIQAAARRSKWIDQSQSLNIFLHSVSGKILSDTYMLAWKLGLKTTYYLRTLSASQVTKSTVDNPSEYYSKKEASKETPAESYVALKAPTESYAALKAPVLNAAGNKLENKYITIHSTGDSLKANGKDSYEDEKTSIASTQSAKEAVDVSINNNLCSLDDSPDCEACQ